MNGTEGSPQGPKVVSVVLASDHWLAVEQVSMVTLASSSLDNTSSDASQRSLKADR
jgi:hypothetical protein